MTLSADDCRVLAGQWFDPYTGNTYTNPSDLDIDHMVPLENAHRNGAHAWSPERKQAFANDLLLSKSLIAVSASANRSKGSRSPAEWLPPNTAYHCEYVKNWLEVTRRHTLGLNEATFLTVQNVIGAHPQFAMRDESEGWDEMARKRSSAVFGLGVRVKDQCAYTSQAWSNQDIEVTISVLPDSAHINQNFNIYLVAEMGGTLLSIDAYGQFTPFNGDLSTLKPFQENIELRQSHELTVFSGVLNDHLSMNLYLGYSTENGDFVYTNEPIPFIVAPILTYTPNEK